MSDAVTAPPQRLEFVVSDDLGGDGSLHIAADAYGNPSHRPVLLLHGGGQTRHSWGTTATVLARAGWYAVSYDQRGHGQSDRSPTAHYEPGRFAEDLVEIAA